jgi:hypothetical protein
MIIKKFMIKFKKLDSIYMEINYIGYLIIIIYLFLFIF